LSAHVTFYSPLEQFPAFSRLPIWQTSTLSESVEPDPVSLSVPRQPTPPIMRRGCLAGEHCHGVFLALLVGLLIDERQVRNSRVYLQQAAHGLLPNRKRETDSNNAVLSF